MNDEERNVMTILTLARIAESSLFYCLPSMNPAGFSKEEREQRYRSLKALTAKGSPFEANCRNNGEAGKKLFDMMRYFIEDVYEEPGRIVTVDLQGHVNVEPSLIVELFTSIVQLRAYLEAFMISANKFLAQNNKLEPDFEKLVHDDIRYYHAFAGKVSSILLSNKFLELNQNGKTYTDSYSKSHGGINPKNDPEFDVRNDPSFRMIENEFHTLNQDMVDVLNTFGNDGTDEEFKYAREQTYNDCDIFTGKKATTDINAYFRIFTGYFDKIIGSMQGPLNEEFKSFGEKMQAYEINKMKEQQNKSQTEPAEADKALPKEDR